MEHILVHNDYGSSAEYIDLKIARYFSALDADPGPLVPLAFALASRATAMGHVCLDLTRLPQHPLKPLDMPSDVPLDDLLAQLRRHSAVGRAGQRRPFILDASNRLYLFRYWQYEHFLGERILEKASIHTDIINMSRFKDAWRHVFPNDRNRRVLGGPRLAAAVACLKPFCVISGGPGTGKTSLIYKIITLLHTQKRDSPMNIHLTAPTGKAAARLNEALTGWASRQDTGSLGAGAISREAKTIHRTLIGRWGSFQFHHDAGNPLATDLVVVDEASMVDLALMAKLVRAMPPHARLILVGDRHQLSSVEPGAVFGDICPAGDVQRMSRRLHESIQELTGQVPESSGPLSADAHPVGDAIARLTHSYRFSDTQGVGQLAQAVNRGDAAEVIDILERPGNQPELTWIDNDAGVLPDILGDHLLDGFRGYLSASNPEKALEMFNRFRILCATVAGPWGVAALNDLAYRVLRSHGLLPPGSDIGYSGRPILITRNDYHLNLYNGDLGIVVTEGQKDGRRARMACFPGASGTVRRIAVQKLPPHETAFAMTVHKSQGSEFDKVLVILPGQDLPVITRELLYTAITRAREQVVLCGDRHIIAAAVKRRIERSSGLRDALWG